MLNITDLHCEIDNKAILKGINLQVRPGEIHAIMGKNGSGKSTLSNLITGKEGYKVSKGDIIKIEKLDQNEGDTISFDKILRLYATAVNKQNNIAQEFIRTQIVPSPMSLDMAIKSLYDDYGYQQNIIESLLPQEVRTLFFGENSMVSVADVAESKLLAFSLLGGRIMDNSQRELFIFVPYSKKGLLGSNETIVISSTSRIYEVPLLNVPLALNVLRSLGFNAKIIQLKQVYIDESSYCKVGEGGLWYHYKDREKMVGCDFLSNTIKSITTNTLKNSADYPIFKESIDRVYEIMNN